MTLDIRQALLAQASDAPDTDQLMDQLSTRLDREAGRTRRHAAMGGAAAAVALAAAVGTYPALQHQHTSTAARPTLASAARATDTTVHSPSSAAAKSTTGPVFHRPPLPVVPAVAGGPLVRVAPAPRSWGFSAALMPTGWHIVPGETATADSQASGRTKPAFTADRYTSLYTRTATARTVNADNTIIISLDADYPAGPFPAKVNGHTARIWESQAPFKNQTLQIKQAGAAVLTVQLPRSLRLTRSQLLRLGASITVRAHAGTSHG